MSQRLRDWLLTTQRAVREVRGQRCSQLLPPARYGSLHDYKLLLPPGFRSCAPMPRTESLALCPTGAAESDRQDSAPTGRQTDNHHSSRSFAFFLAEHPWTYQSCLNSFLLFIFEEEEGDGNSFPARLITEVKFVQQMTTEHLLCAGPSVHRKLAVGYLVSQCSHREMRWAPVPWARCPTLGGEG